MHSVNGWATVRTHVQRAREKQPAAFTADVPADVDTLLKNAQARPEQLSGDSFDLVGKQEKRAACQQVEAQYSALQNGGFVQQKHAIYSVARQNRRVSPVARRGRPIPQVDIESCYRQARSLLLTCINQQWQSLTDWVSFLRQDKQNLVHALTTAVAQTRADHETARGLLRNELEEKLVLVEKLDKLARRGRADNKALRRKRTAQQQAEPAPAEPQVTHPLPPVLPVSAQHRAWAETLVGALYSQHPPVVGAPRPWASLTPEDVAALATGLGLNDLQIQHLRLLLLCTQEPSPEVLNVRVAQVLADFHFETARIL